MMILTEPTAQSSSKSGESSPLNRQELLNPPPAYVQDQPFISYSNSRPEYRRSAARRFFEAFCVAVAIFFLLSVFTSSAVWVYKDKALGVQVGLEIIG